MQIWTTALKEERFFLHTLLIFLAIVSFSKMYFLFFVALYKVPYRILSEFFCYFSAE
jgi:hypothetical protein